MKLWILNRQIKIIFSFLPALCLQIISFFLQAWCYPTFLALFIHLPFAAIIFCESSSKVLFSSCLSFYGFPNFNLLADTCCALKISIFAFGLSMWSVMTSCYAFGKWFMIWRKVNFWCCLNNSILALHISVSSSLFFVNFCRWLYMRMVFLYWCLETISLPSLLTQPRCLVHPRESHFQTINISRCPILSLAPIQAEAQYKKTQHEKLFPDYKFRHIYLQQHTSHFLFISIILAFVLLMSCIYISSV